MVTTVVNTADFRRSVADRVPTFFRGGALGLEREISIAGLLREHGETAIPLEISLDKIYRPDPRIRGGRYARYNTRLVDAHARMKHFATLPYGCYVSNLSPRIFGKDIATLVPETVMLEDRPAPDMAMFFGSDGSGSHWHYDATDNIIVVLSGAKQVRVAPFEAVTPHDIGVHCANFAAGAPPDDPAQVLVAAGDCFYLPCGWWHEVINSGMCMALSVVYQPPDPERQRWPAKRLEISKAREKAKGPQKAAPRVQLRPHDPDPAPMGPRPNPSQNVKGVQTMQQESGAGAGDDAAVLIVGGERLSLSDLFHGARQLKQLDFVDAVARHRILQDIAQERGIEIDDDMLQQVADDFRAANGLLDAEDTYRWLAANAMDLDDLEVYLESLLLPELVQGSFSFEEIETFFEAGKGEFDVVILRSIIVGEEPLAIELASMIAEDVAPFEELAARYSNRRVDQLTNGRVTLHHRRDLPRMTADLLFAATPGDVFEPTAGDLGWMVQRLEEIRPAALDAETEALLRRTMLSLLIQREGYYWDGQFAASHLGAGELESSGAGDDAVS